MARPHLICRDARHASRLGDGTIDTGYWELYPPQAERMVGNTIYLADIRKAGWEGDRAARGLHGGIVD